MKLFVHKLFIFALSCFLVRILPVYGDGYLLKSPPPAKMEESEQKSHDLGDMNFVGTHEATGYTRNINFRYFQEKTYLLVQFQGQLPEELTTSEIQKLKKSQQNIGAVWSFVYPTPDETIYEELTRIGGTTEEEMGRLTAPLIVENGQPKKLSVTELAEKIDNKCVVLYTGAGISADVVPAMGQILQQLEISDKVQDSFMQTIRKALHRPEPLVAFMDGFNQACLNGEPTTAHWAIKELTLQKNWGLMTENLDQLHQRTGVTPLSHDKDWLKNNVSLEDLKHIDVILTVGLRSDESGFLSWYKQHNPTGVIVAVNLEQPNYLSNQDYLVVGDIQAILPQLQQLVLVKTSF